MPTSSSTRVQVDQEPNENSDDMNIPPLGKENNSRSTVPKKMMEASDLLSKHARGRENVIDAVSSTGRRGSSEMKYSSISSPPTSTIRSHLHELSQINAFLRQKRNHRRRHHPKLATTKTSNHTHWTQKKHHQKARRLWKR